MAGPPEEGFTSAEETRIAYYMTETGGGLSRQEAEAKVLAGRSKEKPERTRTQLADDALRAALVSLGIKLAPKDFAGFQKIVQAAYGLAHYTGEFTGTLDEYLKNQAQRKYRQDPLVAGKGEENILAPAALETMLADWQEENAAKEEEKAREPLERRTAGVAAKLREGQRRLAEAQLKDYLAEMKLRYPKNKALIDQILGPALLERWEQANAEGRADWEAFPPELRETLGGGGFGEIPLDGFLRQVDLGQLADEQGFGDNWQAGLFQGSLERNVFDYFRKAAKTPEQVEQAENLIDQLKRSDLQARFEFAQHNQPGLTSDQWLRGEEAGGIIRRIAQGAPAGPSRPGAAGPAGARTGRQAWLQDQAVDLAGRGLNSQQIIDLLGLGPEEAAFVRNLPLEGVTRIATGRPPPPGASVVQLPPGVSRPPPPLPPDATAGERMAAGLRWQQGMTVAQQAAALYRGGIFTREEYENFANAPEAEGLWEQLIAARDRAFERQRLRAEREGALTSRLTELQGEEAGGALKFWEQFQASAPSTASPYRNLAESSKSLFGVPGGREFAQASLEGLMAQYRQETENRLNLLRNPPKFAGPPGEEPSYDTSPLPAFREYIQPFLPQIAGQFAEFRKKLGPIENDEEFRPTLNQLLTNYGIQAGAPGDRESLLARHLATIQNTYAQFQRRRAARGIHPAAIL